MLALVLAGWIAWERIDKQLASTCASTLASTPILASTSAFPVLRSSSRSPGSRHLEAFRMKLATSMTQLASQLIFRQEFLGWHVCRTKLARKIYLEARIFSRKMLRNSLKFLSLPLKIYLEARILSRKMLRNFPEVFKPSFPPNFPPNFPLQNKNKIHRRASAGAQGE